MHSDLIFDKLNNAPTIRSFITISVSLFNESVDELINRIFRQENFVVKSVIDSLFEIPGPLSDLSIRLKVLLGLGVIEHYIFADIMQFIQFKDFLNNESREFLFTEETVLEFAKKLNLLENKPLLQPLVEPEIRGSLLFQMKQLRQEKLLRSCLVLTISKILEHLAIESPFK